MGVAGVTDAGSQAAQLARMPAHTMKRRWVICQIAGANCMYSDIIIAPTIAQIRNEIRPRVSAR